MTTELSHERQAVREKDLIGHFRYKEQNIQKHNSWWGLTPDGPESLDACSEGAGMEAESVWHCLKIKGKWRPTSAGGVSIDW